MNRSKDKGTAFETAVARYLATRLPGQPVERRTLQGVNDRGDIAGVTLNGYRVTIECKNVSRVQLPKHMRELEREKQNDRADVGLLINHAPGCGFTDHGMAGQWVTLTLGDLLTLTGN